MEQNQCNISVIVPLYKGKKYIPWMTAQIEECAKCLSDGRIELVYSNDDPRDFIESDYVSETISVKIINTDKNRGIHGARVRGLSNSTGEYILFLDQDDKVVPEYFVSQLNAIGCADAVICNARSAGRIKYNMERPLYKAGSRESMINEGNMILSPGQVLLRREAVSISWIENIVRQNGADDWLLWLCMHSDGRQFAINSNVLFIREVHYQNTSFDSQKMTDSEKEVVEIINRSRLLQSDERARLTDLLPKLQEKRVKENDKWKKMFLIMNDWLCLHNRGMSIANYLADRGIKTIAIYGYGYLGEALLENLESGEVKVSYVIDQNAKFLEVDKKCYSLNDSLGPADAAIITLLSDSGTIAEERLREKFDGKIFWLENIVFDISKQM